MAGIRAKGEAVEALVSLADYAPTLLELAGISADRSFAGRSLVPFLEGKTSGKTGEPSFLPRPMEMSCTEYSGLY